MAILHKKDGYKFRVMGDYSSCPLFAGNGLLHNFPITKHIPKPD